MGDTVGCRPGPENPPWAHVRSTMHERCSGKNGAQKYLKPAVTADIIECAPNQRAFRRADGSIAPARLARVCTTSFGNPVVPEVRRIHSVWCDIRRSQWSGTISGLQVMKHPTRGNVRSKRAPI